MRPTLVQTTLFGNEKYGRRNLLRIVDTGLLGKDNQALGSQIPEFKDVPMNFCSYLCDGYREIYGPHDTGVIFETDAEPIYVLPCDSFDLMRGGAWLPGYSRFVFASVKEMLRKYPSSEDFKNEFCDFFRKLEPEEVYPNLNERARPLHALDYCLRSDWKPGCNEIAFRKPLKIKNAKIFSSRSELNSFLS